jgi:Flp pilus assembly protein CpaB
MVLTRSTDGIDAEPRAPHSRRTVERLPGLPGARAIVGGMLVALAGVGTFVAWQRATAPPGMAFAVAAQAVAPGEALTRDDVRFESIELPPGVAAAAFSDPASLEGRVALGPIGEGELVQLGQVSDQGGAEPSAEFSFSVDRDRAVDGRLRQGDRVDVFVTVDERTTAVAEDMQLVDVRERDGGSFASGGELTVTVAITDPDLRADLIHAAREGEVTLVRSTHLRDARGATS